MTRLRFVGQFRTKGMWFDEFWSYCPGSFYKAFEPKQLENPLNWRAVLRIVKLKTFEEIKKEQGKI